MFDGVAELEPGNGQWIRVDNMLAKSGEDIDLQTAILSLLTYVSKIGVASNIISS